MESATVISFLACRSIRDEGDGRITLEHVYGFNDVDLSHTHVAVFAELTNFVGELSVSVVVCMAHSGEVMFQSAPFLVSTQSKLDAPSIIGIVPTSAFGRPGSYTLGLMHEGVAMAARRVFSRQSEMYPDDGLPAAE